MPYMNALLAMEMQENEAVPVVQGYHVPEIENHRVDVKKVLTISKF